MDKKVKIESKFLLAVEGKDECNFFKALLTHLEITEVQLIDIGGKDNFLLEFPALTFLEGFNSIERLGFVRDAETRPAQSAFSSVCMMLQKHKLPVPAKPNEIICEGALRLGIYIMPDNAGTGMLENLCLASIALMPISECIEKYIQCFSTCQEKEEKSAYNDSKARVQTYLASRAPLVNSLGLGALRGYWDFHHQCFDGIKDFIKQLFRERVCK